LFIFQNTIQTVPEGLHAECKARSGAKPGERGSSILERVARPGQTQVAQETARTQGQIHQQVRELPQGESRELKISNLIKI